MSEQDKCPRCGADRQADKRYDLAEAYECGSFVSTDGHKTHIGYACLRRQLAAERERREKAEVAYKDQAKTVEDYNATQDRIRAKFECRQAPQDAIAAFRMLAEFASDFWGSADPIVAQLEGFGTQVAALTSGRDRLQAENVRLTGIVGRLPKTADGKIALDGLRVWHPAKPYGPRAYYVEIIAREPYEAVTHSILECYSTREAAQAAKEKP